MNENNMEPIHLTEEPRQLKLDKAKPNTNDPDPNMTTQHKLMNSIMEMIEAEVIITETKMAKWQNV